VAPVSGAYSAPAYASPAYPSPADPSPGYASPAYPPAYPAQWSTIQPSIDLLQAKQVRLDGFIALGVLFWAAVGAALLLINRADVGYYRALWHWWHEALPAIRAGHPAPRQPTRPLWSTLASLVGLAALVIEILFWVWQHRAATVARALNYPARRSPGWGVGCWFVPVVNLWMPYQAIRDCLPPGHPARRRTLYAWLGLLLISILLGPATIVAMVGAPAVAVVLIVISVGAYAGVGLTMRQVVRAIAADHRDAVAALGRP
jgi:hypothetical protein